MDSFENQLNILLQNVAGWEQQALNRIGQRINRYGKMSVEELQAINNLADITQDMNAIAKDLEALTKYTAPEIEKMYADVINSQHWQNKPLYDYRGKKFLPFAENKDLQALVRGFAKSSAGTMLNLSKTKAFKVRKANGQIMGLKSFYTNSLDKAIMQVSSGALDFHSAMRNTIEELGGSGVRVEYESGCVRRLTTAVRQNLMWGAKQTSVAYNEMLFDELGCNGYEIDYHSSPRPSHEFMQGKQYIVGKGKTINGVYFESFADAEKALEDFGCLHYKTPIICGISEPRYTPQELEHLKQQDKVKHTIDGKEYTNYEATQEMRRIETAIRNATIDESFYKTSGYKDRADKETAKIVRLKERYKKISDITGIPQDRDRMKVVLPKEATPTPKKVSDIPKTIEQVNERGTKGIEKIVEDRIDSQELNLVKPKDISKSAVNPYSVDLTGIEAKNADMIVDTVEELSSKYKTTIQGYRTGKKGEFFGRSGTFATTEYNSTTASSDIVFNKAKVDGIDRIKELSQKGWSIKVKEGFEDRYVATHEFAHTVVPNTTIPLKNYVGYDIKPQQSARRELNALFGEYKEKVQGLQREYKQTEFDFIMGDVSAGEKARALKSQLDSIKISDYSLENVDEFMAEAFTSHEIGTIHTKYEKRVMDIILKYFKK